ncbi:hypothetical protein ACF1AB_16540 [Streptomyces sp. NPDC014846]|uniref:hypothetical protein n=1 Tax=Streptomyces sp. NPDC014846 TaxID=3364922 RepID=UPI0036FF6C8D
MAHSTQIPPVDIKPTGRALPFIPEQPREHSTDAERCAEFPGLCTSTGPHTAHNRHVSAKTTDGPVSYGFETVGDGFPLLYVDKGHAADFTATEAPAIVAQLRAAADAIEAMAAQLTAIQQGSAQA